jgi:hypothetical protein
LATADTTALPHPANVAADKEVLPLAVNIGSCKPLALTAALSDPPDEVGLAAGPLSCIDIVPFTVQFPVT